MDSRPQSREGPTTSTDDAKNYNGSTSDVDNAAHDHITPNPTDKETHAADPQPETKQAEAAANALPAVDQGLRAWLTVLGGFCGLFVSFGWVTAIGVFQDAYQTSILSSYSPSTISWILSLEAFMLYFNGFWVGLLFDNHGPRPIVAAGSVFHVAGILGASFGSKYWHFILCQGVISPIGCAAIFYPCLNSVVGWFVKKRGVALGITVSGAAVGGVIFPIMVQQLIPTVGFGWAMRAADLVVIVLLVVVNLTLRTRTPPSPRSFNPLEFVRPLSEPRFFVLTLGAFFVYMGFFIPYNFLPVQALHAGVSPGLAMYMVPFLNAASVPGRITPAWLSDYVGPFNVNCGMTFLCAVLTLALWLPAQHSAAALIVYALGYGFGTGAFVAILPAMIVRVSPDLKAIGARTGTLFASIALATLVGNPIAGALLGPNREDYSPLIIFGGVFVGGGSLVLCGMRMWLSGGKLWMKI